MGGKDEFEELDKLANRGAEVLEAGLRSEEPQRVWSRFQQWFQVHGRISLDELIASVPPGKSSTYRIGYLGAYFREGLGGDDARAAADLRSVISSFPPAAEQPAEPPPPAHEPSPAAEPRPAPRAGDNVGFHGGTYHGPVVGVLNQHTYVPAPGAFVVPDPDSWPTLGEADPVALGVRPTRRLRGLPRLAAHVPRDVDPALDGWNDDDGLLVITGGPMCGRSRTAWETVRRQTPPDARVYAPAPGADLRALPGLLRGRTGTYVLWLDDLNAHLGEHGLEPGLLAQLTALGVPVVGTMRDDVYDGHLSADGPAHRLLVSARTERLATGWSAPEVRRLAGNKDDPSLADAFRWHGDTGITQYLAIASLLSTMWRRAGTSLAPNHGGHLLVRAAVDLARCGVGGDIPQELLIQACRAHGGTFLRGEEFTEALAWATKPLHGVTGMLVRGADRQVGESVQTWRPYGSLVADVLRDPYAPPVPFALWQCALEGTHYDTEVQDAVWSAAQELFVPKTEEGDTEAMLVLGLLAEGLAAEGTALEWFRKAVDAGKEELSGRVGELLLVMGEAEQALPYLRRAAQRKPDGHEARLVGEAHQALAAQWFQKAADQDDMRAAMRLGDLALGRGAVGEALTCYTRVLEHGDIPVGKGLEMCFRLLSPMEPPMTLPSNWTAYAGQGMALMTGRAAAELQERARKRYEDGITRADADAAHRLAVLLEKQSKPAEAELWYRKAAAMGHPGARKALGANPATVDE
ncbi:hypothetical protein [Streptomyces sp. NPDC050263]|uniref:tetratricopeptide repeat protein n=1 Tax=Streptomyces sp. NPDC050263 TaxID=3155037 RepID=UPI0034479A72